MEHWSDYVLFVVFLAISLGIGVFFSLAGGRQKTNEEFLMADRSLKVIPTAISLMASYKSAIMIIGFPAEMYVGGTNYWLLSSISVNLAIVLVSIFLVPWLYQMKLLSIFEVLEMRFGVKYVRIYACCLGIIVKVVYMGTALLAPSVALEIATGFPAKVSIPVQAVVCVIYTSLGGMKAVIWTDVFQAVIMEIGMLTILIKGLLVVGGLEEAFRSLSDEGRTTFIFSPDPTVRHTFWEFLFGSTCFSIYSNGLNQAATQRICAVGSVKDARRTVLLNMVISILTLTLAHLIGVVVVAYFSGQGCDPLVSGDIKRSNELLPLFVRDVFKGVHGFGGLFLAALYSGALSSVSSALSGAAANTWEDIFKHKMEKRPQKEAVWITKSFVVIYGAAAVGFAFMINAIPGPIVQVSWAISGAIAGPVTGLFVLASTKLLSWCESKGALVGGILGLAFNIWLTVGSVFVKAPSQSLPPLSVTNCTQQAFTNSTATHIIPPVSGFAKMYTVSYLWKPLLGCLFTVLVGMIYSSINNCLAHGKDRHKIPEAVFWKLPRQYEKVERNDAGSSSSDVDTDL